MSEHLNIPQTSDRKAVYAALLPQLEALLNGENDFVANLANVAAALKEALGYFWVGFYRVVSSPTKEELVLGPFQGPLACSRIAYGRGVCGTAWKEGKTQWVPDVEQFPGHISCSSLSKSEVVVPLFDAKERQRVIGVLDVDSDRLDDFTADEVAFLDQVGALISQQGYSTT